MSTQQYFGLTRVLDSLLAASPMNQATQADILGLLSGHPDLQEYFWGIVEHEDLFLALNEKKYFRPNAIPTAQKNDEGKMIIRYWPPLDYLEKLSKNNRSVLAFKLLDILNEVSSFTDDSGNHIDNYYVWHKFVSILGNLPNKVLSKYLRANHIDIQSWLSVWMSSKYEVSVVSSDMATKLLPKFITDDPSDIKIAEAIVKALLSIRIGEDHDSLWSESCKKKKAFLRGDPYWIAEGLLKKSKAKELGAKCSIQFIKYIFSLLDVALRYESFSTYEDIETNDYLYRVFLFRLEGEAGIIDNQYQMVVRRIDRSIYEEKKKKDSIYAFRAFDIGNLIAEFKLNGNKRNMTAHALQQLAASPEEFKNQVNLSFLTALIKGLCNDYSYVWLRSLKQVGSHQEGKASGIITLLLRDVMDAQILEGKNITSITKILNAIASKELVFPLLKRITLYLISNHFEQLKPTFERMLNGSVDLFYTPAFDVELYDLLQVNAQAIANDQNMKTLLRNKILALSKRVKAKLDEKQIAYRRQRWFQALAVTPEFVKSAEIQAMITKQDVVEPPQHETTTVWTGPGKSSVTLEAMLDTPNTELVEKLNAFEKEVSFGPNKPTQEGLASTLQGAVKACPEKFYNELAPFLTTKFIFANSLLRGFQDVWNDKKTLNWDAILKYVRNYLDAPYFKKHEKDEGSYLPAYRQWVISAAADLLAAGCNKDEWAIADDLFDEFEKTYTRLLEERYDPLPEKADIQEVINTPTGRIVESYILFSLRRARYLDEKKDANKERFNRAMYEQLLRSNVPEAYTLFGRYLTNIFYYLDKEWAKEKIAQLATLPKNEILWKGFFQGYIFGPGIYEELYYCMQRHYLDALAHELEYEGVQSQLVEHAVLAHLRSCENNYKEDGFDNPNSLLRKILDEYKLQHWKKTMDTFWSHAKSVIEEQKKGSTDAFLAPVLEKIKRFWDWFFQNEEAKVRFGEKYTELLADVAKLLVVFDHLSEEIYQKTKIFFPFIDRFHDSVFLVEYLDKFTAEDDLKYVGLIYLEMLKKNTPTYDKKHIENIVSKLFDSGNSDKANEICNTYGERGLYFLKEIWEQHNG